MNLELLVGPSGVGKTNYILEDIDINRKDNKIIVLTPEQNSFNFEKILCDKFGGTFNIDVMNFSSLTRRLAKQLGIDNLKRLGDNIKPFYFYRAAKNIDNSENFLVKRILQDVSFIEVVEEIINELKEYTVSINTLEEYLEKNTLLEKSHREKLEAILEIYVEYTRLLKEQSTFDKVDYITELLLYLEYVDLSDYIFYVDAYYNFTAQEYNYIEKLAKKSKKLIISVISDANRYFNFDLSQLIQGYELEKMKYNSFYLSDLFSKEKYKLDIFRKSHEIIASMNEIVRNNKDIKFTIIAFVKNEMINTLKLSIKDNNVENYSILESHVDRFKGVSNSILAENYYKNFVDKYEADDSLEIICAKNKELEVKQVAREIVKMKSKNTVNHNDIAILYRDNTYENYINIFKDYDLEVHLDKNIETNNHRLVKFIQEVLSFNDGNFKTRLLNLLKTRLTNFENIYRQKVISHILLDDTSVNEKQLEKLIAELDENSIKEKISKSSLIFKSTSKFSYNELLDKVKVISVDDVENILNEKLVNSSNDILKDYFVEKTIKYSTEQLRICKEVLLEFSNKVSEVSMKDSLQVKRYVKKLVDVFDYCKIRMYLDKEDGDYDDIEELKVDSIDRQVYKKILEYINDINENFGNDKFEYQKFVTLFNAGLTTIKYRSIPEINNSIIMSTMDLAKVENKKVVFVIGFNKDVLPVSKSTGLIDDKDKEELILRDIFLSPTKEAALIDEEFVAYVALTRAKEKTYICYSLLDKSFKENFASPYLNTVKSLFPQLEEKHTSKILEFSISDYNYYLGNFSEIVSDKEFNYLFSKVYRRFLEVKDSRTKEVEVLVELLIKFLEEYRIALTSEHFENYEVFDELNDRVFLSKDVSIKNYISKIIKDYKYELNSKTIGEFLNAKGDSFSKFSISKISDFERNPYHFFIKRVLGIAEERDVDIDNLVSGRFFHAVMAEEKIIKFIYDCGTKLDIEVQEDRDIAKKFKVKEIIKEVTYSSDNKDILETLKLIELLNTYKYILNTMIQRLEIAIAIEIKYFALTKFMPSFLEKPFILNIKDNIITCENVETGEVNKKELKQDYKIPPIRFVGVIDRVDVLDKNISIIDYKSSQTDFTLDSIELGFISQILTYALACELMFGKKSEDILGIFYREIAKLGKDLKTYRLRGLANSDLILKDDFIELAPEVMYVRTTRKGSIHGSDVHKAYTSPELEKLVDKNLHNIMSILEKIFSFDYSLSEYEIDNQYLAEKQTLFNFASNSDTRLSFKNKVELKPKELKEKLLKEQ
jgi:hypothetical protein